MKRTVICAIPMNGKVEPVIYRSSDPSLEASERKVRFPMNAYLEKTLRSGDELKVLLLIKRDENGSSELNVERFKEELKDVNSAGAQVSYVLIETEFSEERAVHEKLMGRLVDAIGNGEHLYVDMTYGPKDLPIILFAALNFAEKFLGCTVENLLYGQAGFDREGHPVGTKLCDMIPLYCLGSLTNLISCDDPEKAREMLKTLLSV